MNTELLTAQLHGQIWALHPPAMSWALTGISPHGRNAASGAQRRSGRIFVMPLYGVLVSTRYWATLMPWATPLDRWTEALRQGAASADVVVINCDSPGGMVAGTAEAADAVYAMRRSGKKTVAQCRYLMASAALWICSSCDEISITPSGEAGSIGCYAQHTDYSKQDTMLGVKTTLISAGRFKMEGNSYEPLGDDARAAMQAMVDYYGQLFVKAVARGRGVSVDQVRNGFGQGRMLTAQAAVKAGLCDRVATLDETLMRLGVPASALGLSAAAVSSPSEAMFRRRMRAARYGL